MSAIDDAARVAEIAGDSVPVVLVLVAAIAKIVAAKEDQSAQLDALQTAAEAVKLRMDQLKFPGEAQI